MFLELSKIFFRFIFLIYVYHCPAFSAEQLLLEDGLLENTSTELFLYPSEKVNYREIDSTHSTAIEHHVCLKDRLKDGWLHYASPFPIVSIFNDSNGIVQIENYSCLLLPGDCYEILDDDVFNLSILAEDSNGKLIIESSKSSLHDIKLWENTESENYIPVLQDYSFKHSENKEAIPSYISYVQPPHVSQKVWNSVIPYLLPENHPIKASLDRIFNHSRAILSLKSLKKAGFNESHPRRFTRLIVTKHPDVPGYIFKLYLDAQRYHKEKPEYYYWILRIRGAQIIQSFIDNHGFQNLFKVPKKWIYPLPATPAPPEEFLRKNFILVEEDMNVYDDETNKKIWRSSAVTPQLLNALYAILKEVGLHDCVKPDNIPFSRDGRIAFIDTQTFHSWPVDYKEFTSFLPSSLQAYWKDLYKKDK